jgi:hypothetical protein
LDSALAGQQCARPGVPIERECSRTALPVASRSEQCALGGCIRYPQRAPLAFVVRQFEQLRASVDPNVTSKRVGVGRWMKPPKAPPLRRAALPRIVDVDLHSDLEWALGAAANPYGAKGGAGEFAKAGFRDARGKPVRS